MKTNDQIISKELLSAILKRDIEEVKNIMGSTLYFNVPEHGDYINVYELAHKCKEWAENLKYTIASNNYSATISYNEHQEEDDDRHLFWKCDEHKIFKDTEVNSIFKACQWILDNKETK